MIIKSRKVKLCLVCGERFLPKNNNCFVCSPECYETAKEKGLLQTKTCPNCGTVFETSNNVKNFCTRSCEVEFRQKRLKTPIIKVCPECGREFETPYKFKKFCKRECAMRFHMVKQSQRKKRKRGLS